MNELLLHHQPLLQALGLAMLHSLGQGFILFLLLKMILPFIPGSRANVRYLVSYAALVLLFIGFGYTFINEWQTAKAIAVMPDAGHFALGVTAHDVAVAPAQPAWSFSLAHYTDTLRRYLPLAALGYAIGICLLCCRMLWQLFKVQSLRKDVIVPDEQLNGLFTALRERVGWRNAITIRLSSRVNVPVVFGHLKPLVLLPVALATRLDVQQLEAIILHEIGHVKRHDYLFNILQSVIETLLFFNPFTRWIAANIRLEREHCCDDFVLKHTRQSLPYAYVLLALEEYRSASLSPAMAADGNSKSPLFNRIKRITNMTTPQQKNQRSIGAVTLLVLVAAMVCFATAFSQDKKTKESGAKAGVTATEQAAREEEDTHPVTRTQTSTRTTTSESTEETEDTGVMTASEAMKVAKQAMATASKSMKEIDWNKIASDVEKASKDIDWDVVNQSLEQAKASIDAIDWAEVRQSVKNAQSSIDWSEVKKAMEEASKEVDKAMKEVEQELKNGDNGHSFNSRMAAGDEETLAEITRKQQDAAARMRDKAAAARDKAAAAQDKAMAAQDEALKAQDIALRKHQAAVDYAQNMARVKQEEALQQHREALKRHNEVVARAQERAREAQAQAAIAADKARASSDKARKSSDDLVDRLARKGLVNKDGNFKVKLTKDKLVINGKEQPEAIAREFRSFVESDGQTWTISVNHN